MLELRYFDANSVKTVFQNIAINNYSSTASLRHCLIQALPYSGMSAFCRHCLVQALPYAGTFMKRVMQTLTYILQTHSNCTDGTLIVHLAFKMHWSNLGQAVADATIPPAALLMQSLLDGVGQDKNKDGDLLYI